MMLTGDGKTLVRKIHAKTGGQETVWTEVYKKI